jgi:4-diphosphocytidyl-2-C-methyl-D-erythritol kinase
VITTIAPAKLNWTLEVLGRRDDGYHEVRTVMQAIDLCDEVSAEAAESLTIARDPAYDVTNEADLTRRAATALATGLGREPQAAVRVRKRIPLGAGLGGGSSDAAATLRALDALWAAGTPMERLAEVAATLGSDVAFFLHGGTALAEGRGERITPLADAPAAWLVLLVPPVAQDEKTKRMYSALTPADFSDGARTEALLAHLRSGRPLMSAPLCNAFERAAYDAFFGLAFFRDALLQAGASSVHVSGSGPALFAVASGEEEARAVRARVARVRRGEKVHVVRTLTAAESTAVWSDGEA